jgi:hypothetical protein
MSVIKCLCFHQSYIFGSRETIEFSEFGYVKVHSYRHFFQLQILFVLLCDIKEMDVGAGTEI